MNLLTGLGAGVVSRRALLIVGAGGAGAVLLPRPAGAAADAAYAAFLEAAEARLAPLLPAASPAAQEAYVYAAAAALRRLATPPTIAFNDQHKIDIKPNGLTKVFSVTFLRAKPRAVLPPHNHPFYSVATLGLSGAVQVRNFEPVETPPPYGIREPFRLRETRAQALGAGDISTLSPMRDNFHTFAAGPQGAVWMDLSTSHAEKGAGDFSYLRLTSGGRDRVGDVLEARWGLKD